MEGRFAWLLSALNVLDTLTAVICYCNKTCPLALALNFNSLVHIRVLASLRQPVPLLESRL